MFARGFKDDIRKDRVACAPLPTPTKGKNNNNKKKDALTISCMTELFVCAKGWQRGLRRVAYNICGLRYVEILGVFLRDG